MEKNSPNVFAVLNMKRELQQENSFLFVVLDVFWFFICFGVFVQHLPLYLSPLPHPPLASHVQQLDHVAIICFCISLIWVAGIGAGFHF